MEMIYDGFDFEPYLTVENVRRSLLPDVDDSSDNRSGDGSCLKGIKLSPLKIEVDVRIKRPAEDWREIDAKFADVRRKLSARLFRRAPCSLVLYDEPDIENMAVLTGSTVLESEVWTKTTTLTFLCNDPIGYGEEHLRAAEEGGEVRINVGGTYEAKPIIQVDADGPFTMTVDGDDFMVLGHASGATVINSFDRSVTCEGESVQYAIFSDFPLLEPGLHTLSCSLPYTVGWRDAWL